jgi:DNA-directed RNA polymerase subunit RPC12/RpoP
MIGEKQIKKIKRCQNCGHNIFEKKTIEIVYITDVSNYNKDDKCIGGQWDEKSADEGKVFYNCTKCNKELK